MADFIQLHSPLQMQRLLADRLRAARVGNGFKQSTLASRAGVTLASLRRFEQTGEISLKHLMRLFHALGRIDELDSILRPPAATTMAELKARFDEPVRKRGSR
jgi:transcriptional regulator with XRE-family HTH domain